MNKKILEILQEINPYVIIEEDTRLLDEEILDSIGIMVLINEIEEQYDITIPVEDISIGDFMTIKSIEEFVNRYTGR